jgi:hypothetical protein
LNSINGFLVAFFADLSVLIKLDVACIAVNATSPSMVGGKFKRNEW